MRSCGFRSAVSVSLCMQCTCKRQTVKCTAPEVPLHRYRAPYHILQAVRLTGLPDTHAAGPVRADKRSFGSAAPPVRFFHTPSAFIIPHERALPKTLEALSQASHNGIKSCGTSWFRVCVTCVWITLPGFHRFCSTDL